MRLRTGLVAVAVTLVGAVYFANASWLAHPTGKLTVLSHRGVHQTFSEVGVTNDTCTATRIDPPRHRFLENTLPSMRRAFALGADIVEIDIHPTTDGDFAVFHDWTLGCRTDGHGPTREHSLAELKALDAGYGYTADGGRTFPLRGSGVGMIPSLAETLAAFPNRRFLVNLKSADPHEGEALAAYLSIRAPDAGGRITVYGGGPPVARLKALAPGIATWTPAQAKACLARYELMGWAGYVPKACRNSMVFAPQDQSWLLWGWPNRFLARMHAAGSEAYVGGAITPRGGLTGIDDARRAGRVPRDWKGGVSTERIDVVGPLLKPRG